MLKILGALVLMVLAYCQEYDQSRIVSLKTVVTHAVPITRYHYPQLEAVPLNNRLVNGGYTQTVSSQNFVPQKTNKNNNNIKEFDSPFVNPHVPPSEPAPVYESQEPEYPFPPDFVRQVISYAPIQNQAYHQIPIKPQDYYAPLFVPVQHQAPALIQQANDPVIRQAVKIPLLHQATIRPIQQHHTVGETHLIPVHHHEVGEAYPKPKQYHFIEHVPETLNKDSRLSRYGVSNNGYHHGHHGGHDYYAYPKYEFAYEVNDPHTRDVKYQHESRDGDVVKGVYSLQEPDGSIRTVNYGSDKNTGFIADIKHEGHAKHITSHLNHH